MTKIAGISGSLREASFNSALLRVAKENAPDGVSIEIASIAGIPVYNQDDQARKFPDTVEALAKKIRDADAVLIATPEYNYSIPGGLKNAIDWLSRLKPQPFDNKPIAIMGASMSGQGTARSQYHLRQSFVFLNGKVLNKPEIFVAAAHEKFDDNLKLTDDGARDLIGKLVAALADAA